MSRLLYDSGELAENMAEEYFLKHQYPYSLGDRNLQKVGVDFVYSNGKEIKFLDVKNTFELFLCNMYKNLNEIRLSVRHPFKRNGISNELWIWDRFKDKWFYQGDKNEYIKKFFFNQKGMNTFIEAIQDIDRLKFENHWNAFKFLLNFKDEHKYLLNKTFITVIDREEQITLKMIKLDDKKYMERHNVNVRL